MIWLVWRRQRAALLVALGLVATTAVLVVVLRLLLAAAAARIGALPCLDDPNSAVCVDNPAFRRLDARFSAVRSLAVAAVLCLPAVAGVFAGAGLFARELERGTVVLALTQSVSRVRWWATGLLVAGVPVAVAVALLTPLATWALSLRGDALNSRLEPPLFDMTGLVPAAHVLLAFTLAAVAGMLLRNALGAVVLTVVGQFVAQVLLVGLRPYYVPADELRTPLPLNSEVAVAGDGLPAGASRLDLQFLYPDGRVVPPSALDGLVCGDGVDNYDCLRSAGITQQLLTYHDAAEYWPFQAIETAILLGVVALLLVAGRVRLRRIV